MTPDDPTKSSDEPATEADVTAATTDEVAPNTGETQSGELASAEFNDSAPASSEAVIAPAKPTPAAEAASTLSGLGWLIRTAVNATVVILVVAILLTLIGVAQRTGWIKPADLSGTVGQANQAADGGAAKRYICPMMCTPPSSQPGRCPVCAMELVEATSSAAGDGVSVTIEPAARRLVGIQTAVSKLEHVTRTIRTIGAIEFDESRLSTISAYVDGRLEKMYANYVGVPVGSGDDLALIYSPQLYSAQTEFIASLDSTRGGRFDIQVGDLSAMARENLSELGMSAAQIERLAQTRQPESRIRIKSPQSGTVIEMAAVEGDYIKTGQELYRIADLSSVWLMLDLFPDDAASVRFGQHVEAEIQSVRGEVFSGRVAFIDPTVNAKTRTVQVRVEVMNFDGKLRPGDYATARISAPAVPTDLVYDPALAGKHISPMHPQVIRDEPGPCPLCGMDLIPTSELGFSAEPLPEQQLVTVPRSAVLLAGNNAVIYVETEPGRFEIRRVSVGPMTREKAVIVEGLAAGETVATEGNFLIDSQMQLAGNPSLLDPSRAVSFPPGPLELPSSSPVMLGGEAATQFDRAYGAYFEIQQLLAADATPPPTAMNKLVDALTRLEMLAEVPDEAQRQLGRARRAAERWGGSLEAARSAFRTVSHGMLRAATAARGPQTAKSLSHYHCPMVPGSGGDWMQAGGELANPYWGSEMLRCGEVVRDMGLEEEGESGREGDKESGRGGVVGETRRGGEGELGE